MDFSTQVQPFQKPFPHFVIQPFLKKEHTTQLLLSLQKQQFSLLNSDLFTFLQTKDLGNIKEFQHFKSLLLSKELITLIENSTNTKLSSNKMDIFGSIYKNTHHLLPHDDQLEGRAVAFIFYLSTVEAEEGGALGLYASKKNQPTKICKRIQPQFNTFLFFPVTNKSFHEVEEVLTDMERVALSGWFYG